MMCVWDFPLRLFHWLLVLAIVAAYITGTDGGFSLYWHSKLGIFILALVVFRIAWGFVGSTYAQFKNFTPTPGRIRTYLRGNTIWVGHNPVGALSIYGFLILIPVQAGLGLFAMNDEIEFHGPLYELVSAATSERITIWHTNLFNALILLIGLHFFAIVYYSLIRRLNLVKPMFTGRRENTGPNQEQDCRGGGAASFALAAACAALVFWSINSGTLLGGLEIFLTDSEPITETPDW